jgi:hypothetical protein
MKCSDVRLGCDGLRMNSAQSFPGASRAVSAPGGRRRRDERRKVPCVTVFDGAFHFKVATFRFFAPSFRSEIGTMSENHGTFRFQPGTMGKKDGTMGLQVGTFRFQPGTMSKKDGTMNEKDGTTGLQGGTFRLQPRMMSVRRRRVRVGASRMTPRRTLPRFA